MRKLLAASLLLLAACSSTGRNNNTAKLLKPEIRIVQTSEVPAAARYQQGGLNIQYALRVANRSSEPITLQRVTVQSMSEGAYHVGPTSLPFDVKIGGEQFQDVEFWAPARTGLSLVGANGPVTLRVTCQFDSPVGKFQEIVTQVVNDRTDVSGQQ